MKIRNIIIIILLFLISILLNIFFGISLVTICAIIPTIWVITILFWKTFFKTIKMNVLYYIFIFALLYLFLNTGNFIHEKYIEYKLNQFDIDKDGFFSKTEQTTEQKEYMDIITNDLGRNLFFISSFFISLISSLLLFLIVTFYYFIKNKKINTAQPRIR